MPMMDLSEVLTDPMLLDTFSVNRRTQTVNEFGLACSSTQPFPDINGVVYPSDDNDLKRLPDLSIQSKALTVITQFSLRGESETSGSGAASFYPDIVVWNGDQFLVRKIDDYSNYAAGFILAICTSIDLVDQPPTSE
jgi:hypothetical protein